MIERLLREAGENDECIDYQEEALYVLQDARLALTADGVEITRSHHDPASAIVLAEAVNWAAKTIDEWYYYGLKPYVISACVVLGADWTRRGDLILLWAPGLIKPRGFHDPFEEALALLDTLPWPSPVAEYDWDEYEWDGLSRQALSWSLLARARTNHGRSEWFRKSW